MTNAPSPKNNVDQDQFLTILSREDALARFEAALFPRATHAEERPLADALGFPLAHDIVAAIDVPPFDRSNVDGFAVRSADLASASEATPVRLVLERRHHRLRHRADPAGAVGHRHLDCDRRPVAARR